MRRQSLATLTMLLLVSNYLAFQAGQSVRYYNAAPSRSSTARPPIAKAPRAPVPVYGVDQVLKFSPSRVAFGKIADGPVQKRTVTFRNPTAETVTISSIKASCGCTSARIDEVAKTVPPGATGQFEVVFNPALSSPDFAVSLSVEYQGRPQVDRLLVSGQIQRNLD